MENKKYYFITYAWKRTGWEFYLYENEVVSTHPIDVLLEMQETKEDEIKLIFYKQITKEEFDKYEGVL